MYYKSKNRQGFTLVELIVVIAILAVLAAILIPTMLNYVTSSRVSSLNSVANELKKSTNIWLLDKETVGIGMKKSGVGMTVELRFDPANSVGGASANSRCVVVDMTIDNAYFDGSPLWLFNSDKCAIGADLENSYEQFIGNEFSTSEMSAIVYIKDGVCIGVVTTDTTTGFSDLASIPTYTDFEDREVSTFIWQRIDGVGADGAFYGTAPEWNNFIQ